MNSIFVLLANASFEKKKKKHTQKDEWNVKVGHVRLVRQDK